MRDLCAGVVKCSQAKGAMPKAWLNPETCPPASFTGISMPEAQAGKGFSGKKRPHRHGQKALVKFEVGQYSEGCGN